MGPRIYVDLMKTDGKRRIRLISEGTRRDLAAQHIELRGGLALRLYADDAGTSGKTDALVVDGVVEFNSELGEWVAAIDWQSLRHQSDSAAGTEKT